MYFWSWLFSSFVGACLFSLFGLYLILKKRYRDAIFVVASGAASAVFVKIIKALVHRDRPRIDPSVWADGYSFPSGHSTAAACIGILILWFLVPEKKRKYFVFPVTVLVACVGASRIYFGVHYISDVFAGYVLGALIAVATILLDRKTKMR